MTLSTSGQDASIFPRQGRMLASAINCIACAFIIGEARDQFVQFKLKIYCVCHCNHHDLLMQLLWLAGQAGFWGEESTLSNQHLDAAHGHLDMLASLAGECPGCWPCCQLSMACVRGCRKLDSCCANTCFAGLLGEHAVPELLQGQTVALLLKRCGDKVSQKMEQGGST